MSQKKKIQMIRLMGKYKIWQVLPVKIVFKGYTVKVYHIPGTDSVTFLGNNYNGRQWATDNFNSIPKLCEN